MGLVNNKKQIQLSRSKTREESIKLDIIEADVLFIINYTVLHELFNISDFEYKTFMRSQIFEYKTFIKSPTSPVISSVEQVIKNKITKDELFEFYDIIGLLDMFNELYFKTTCSPRYIIRPDECGFIYNILSNNTEIIKCKDYDIFLRHLHNCYLLNENLIMRITTDEN